MNMLNWNADVKRFLVVSSDRTRTALVLPDGTRLDLAPQPDLVHAKAQTSDAFWVVEQILKAGAEVANEQAKTRAAGSRAEIVRLLREHTNTCAILRGDKPTVDDLGEWTDSALLAEEIMNEVRRLREAVRELEAKLAARDRDLDRMAWDPSAGNPPPRDLSIANGDPGMPNPDYVGSIPKNTVLELVVNGEPVKVEVPLKSTIGEAAREAIRLGKHTSRPPEDWEIRYANEELIPDWETPLEHVMDLNRTISSTPPCT